MIKSATEKIIEAFSPHFDENNRISLTDAERLIAQQGIQIDEEFGFATLKETIENLGGTFLLETHDGTPFVKYLAPSPDASGCQNGTTGTPEDKKEGNGVADMPMLFPLRFLSNKDIRFLVSRIRLSIYSFILNIHPNAEGLVALPKLYQYLKGLRIDTFATDKELLSFITTRPDKFEIIERDSETYIRNTFTRALNDNTDGNAGRTPATMEDYLSDTKSPSEKLLMLFRPCLDKNNRISLADAERITAEQGVSLQKVFGFDSLKDIIEELDNKYLLETVDGTPFIRCLMPVADIKERQDKLKAEVKPNGNCIDIHDTGKLTQILFRIKITILNISIYVYQDSEGFVPLDLLTQYLKSNTHIHLTQQRELIDFIKDNPSDFILIERDGNTYVRNNITMTANDSTNDKEALTQTDTDKMESEDTTTEEKPEEVPVNEETTTADIIVADTKTEINNDIKEEGERKMEDMSRDNEIMEEARQEKENDQRGMSTRYISLHKIQDFAIFSNYKAMLKQLTGMAENDGWLVLTDENESQPYYVVDLLLRYNFSQAVELHRKGDNSKLHISLEKASFDTGFHTEDGKHIIAQFVVNQQRNADYCQTYIFNHLSAADKV